MAGSLDASLILEMVLALLLGATLVYCALLERRLRLLRRDQGELAKTIQTLNAGIVRAQMSLSALRGAAADSGEALKAAMAKARVLTDELSVLTASGERIAKRMEEVRSEPAARAAPRHPLAESLRAVR